MLVYYFILTYFWLTEDDCICCLFLADRTLLALYCSLSVCLRCIVAKWYILQQKCLKNSIWSAPWFYNFQPPTLTKSPQTPHLLHHTRWCHLAKKFNLLTFFNLASTVTASKEIGIKSKLRIDSFSATAGILFTFVSHHVWLMHKKASVPLNEKFWQLLVSSW